MANQTKDLTEIQELITEKMKVLKQMPKPYTAEANATNSLLTIPCFGTKVIDYTGILVNPVGITFHKFDGTIVPGGGVNGITRKIDIADGAEYVRLVFNGIDLSIFDNLEVFFDSKTQISISKNDCVFEVKLGYLDVNEIFSGSVQHRELIVKIPDGFSKLKITGNPVILDKYSVRSEGAKTDYTRDNIYQVIDSKDCVIDLSEYTNIENVYLRYFSTDESLFDFTDTVVKINSYSESVKNIEILERTVESIKGIDMYPDNVIDGYIDGDYLVANANYTTFEFNNLASGTYAMQGLFPNQKYITKVQHYRNQIKDFISEPVHVLNVFTIDADVSRVVYVRVYDLGNNAYREDVSLRKLKDYKTESLEGVYLDTNNNYISNNQYVMRALNLSGVKTITANQPISSVTFIKEDLTHLEMNTDLVPLNGNNCFLKNVPVDFKYILAFVRFYDVQKDDVTFLDPKKDNLIVNTSKYEEEFESQIFNSLKLPWITGKNVLIVGTSIPYNDDTALVYSKHPDYAISALGAYPYNMAFGGSPISMIDNEKSLIYTKAEKLAYNPNWTDQQLEYIDRSSLDLNVIPYLSGVNKADLIVIDHGYNDNGNLGLEANWETYYNNRDRETFVGAMSYLINLVRANDVHTRMVIMTHYEKGSGLYNTELLAKCHDWIAHRADIPIGRLHEKTMFSSGNFAEGTAGTTGSVFETDANGNITVSRAWMPDGIHPYSDVSLRSIEHMTRAYMSVLKDIC